MKVRGLNGAALLEIPSRSKTFDTIETLDSHKRLEHSELGQSKPPAGVG
jgi:hypothetical protein